MAPQPVPGFRRPRWRDRRAVAAVEFAVIAPLLLTLLGAAVDLGFAVDRSVRLENAARTAAQYLFADPNDTAGARTAANGTLSGLTGANVAVGTMACTCPAAGSAIGGSTVACTATCATGMVRLVTITASAPFTPIFPTSAMIPFNNLGTLTKSVQVRL